MPGFRPSNLRLQQFSFAARLRCCDNTRKVLTLVNTFPDMLTEARNTEAVMHRVASFPPSRTLHELFQRVTTEITRESFPSEALWDNSSLMSILRSLVNFRVRSPLLCDTQAAEDMLEFLALRIEPETCALDEAAYVVSSLARLKNITVDCYACVEMVCKFVDEIVSGLKNGDAPPITGLATCLWGIVELLGATHPERVQTAVNGAIEFLSVHHFQELRVTDVLMIVRAIGQCEGMRIELKSKQEFWSALAIGFPFTTIDRSSMKLLTKALQQVDDVPPNVWGGLISALAVSNRVHELSPHELATFLRAMVEPVRHDMAVNTTALADSVFEYIEKEPKGRIGPTDMVDICWALSIRSHSLPEPILGDIVSLAAAIAEGRGSVPDMTLGRLSEVLARSTVRRGLYSPAVLEFFVHAISKRSWKSTAAMRMMSDAVAHIADGRLLGSEQARDLLANLMASHCERTLKSSMLIKALLCADVEHSLACLTEKQRDELRRARDQAEGVIADIPGSEQRDLLAADLAKEICRRGLPLRVSTSWRCLRSLCVADLTLLAAESDEPILFVDLNSSPFDLCHYEREFRYRLLSAVYGREAFLRCSDQDMSPSASSTGRGAELIRGDVAPSLQANTIPTSTILATALKRISVVE
ncbi:hypothetical protein FOZ61_006008 [Perkinsus olseni]|uniref:Uncharacterized protein n=1 Tax=Perkinsus olseni TaxID=32597 RepID=A0A7J6LFU2_PEROL|nr:hypothetical protein FOZ61_006008 [Perkinsus olseni]